MAPKYREGDIVIFSPALPACDGDDCFVRFGDGRTTFKRVFFETSAGAATLRLQPRNERYRAETLARSQVRLYKAVCRFQRPGQGVGGENPRPEPRINDEAE